MDVHRLSPGFGPLCKPCSMCHARCSHMCYTLSHQYHAAVALSLRDQHHAASCRADQSLVRGDAHPRCLLMYCTTLCRYVVRRKQTGCTLWFCNVHVHCINYNVGDKPLVTTCNNHKIHPVCFLLTTYLQSAVQSQISSREN